MNNIKSVQQSLTTYNFTVPSAATSNLTRAASKVLVNFFSSVHVLASKPTFTISTNKVVINVFYYISDSKDNSIRPRSIILSTHVNGLGASLSSSAINSVGEVLSKLFNKPVELRLVRLHYPYLNSHILAQYIAINTNKYNFTRIISRLWGANAIFGANHSNSVVSSGDIIPTYIQPIIELSGVQGIKVRVSGRLVTERSVPRQTVKTAQLGSFSATGTKNIMVESSSFTSKNKKGAFTVKVWIGQTVVNESK